MIPILQAKSGIPVPAPRSTRHTGGWGASVAPEREAKGGSRAPVQGFAGRGLRGHMEINRRLGDPDYPATPVVDAFLARVFGG